MNVISKNKATSTTMLTIRETARTGILPETALRTLVKQGRIPGIYVNRKFLVNYECLCEQLKNTPESGYEMQNATEVK